MYVLYQYRNWWRPLLKLDPADPDFYLSGHSDRLDSSDALFVDAIHTDGVPRVQSSFDHLDFYPNGGSVQHQTTSFRYEEKREIKIEKKYNRSTYMLYDRKKWVKERFHFSRLSFEGDTWIRQEQWTTNTRHL
jgi:hypothetical protein